jgi:peptidoglycan hydrolase-like protein with peptidoglycan-binding domain
MFKKPRRKVNRVFLHCSASDIDSHDDIEVIRSWHLSRGFDDIAYHFFIHKNGNLSMGRDLEITPASQKGHNVGTISICLHGYRIENFTYAQYQTLRELSSQINRAYYERVSFHGHCEVASKACPTFNYVQVLKLDKYGSLHLSNSRYRNPLTDNFVRLNYGDRGEAVKRLQRLLGVRATGAYGNETLIKVKDFKAQHGLYPSGIVTKQVWKLLTKPILDNTRRRDNGRVDINNLPDLRQGSRGSVVELLQQYLFLKVDGVFGPQVAKAVRKFKAQHGLYRSDIVNSYVWKLIIKQNSIRG